VAFRDDREAQRARIQALESEVERLTEELRERDAADDEETEEDGRDLIQAATAERDAELTQARAAEEAERRRLRTDGPLERWSVAWNLRRSVHTFLVVLAGIGLLGVLGFGPAAFSRGPMVEGERTVIRMLAVACLVCAFVGSTWLSLSLLALRTFRAKLPFMIDRVGWASLVDKEHFWIAEMWWHVAIGIEGGKKDAVQDALEVLCGRANATFYGAEDPTGDERVRWVRKGRKARGSANRDTALAFVRFCQDTLAHVAGVKRVTLTVGEDTIHVSKPSSD
jgi:hypothetical protein